MGGLTTVYRRMIGGQQDSRSRSLSIKWLNEEREEIGGITYNDDISNQLHRADSLMRSVSEDSQKTWVKEGGRLFPDYDSTRFNAECITRIVTDIRNGTINEILTQAATNTLQKLFHVRIVNEGAVRQPTYRERALKAGRRLLRLVLT